MDHDGDAADVVLLTALELEYAAVRVRLSDLETRRHSAGTLFEVGRLPGTARRVAIAVTGEGNQGAAVLTERAIGMFRPAALLFVGIAGALKSDIDLGDVVVGTKVYAYHGGKDEDDGFLSRPRAWEAPHELDQAARNLARKDTWRRPGWSYETAKRPTVHFKPIAAGEVVLNSRTTTLAQQLRSAFNDAVAIEMESAGVAQAGHLNRSLPVLAIRGISDKAAGDKQVTDGAGWQQKAAANAAAFAVALATEIASSTSVAHQAAGAAKVNPQVNGLTVTAHHSYIDRSPSATTMSQGWTPITQQPIVRWRSDLIGSGGTYGPSTVELHLVPVSDVERIEVRHLGAVAEALATLGRTTKLFTSGEAVDVRSSPQAAWAAADNHRRSAGLAVDRDGRRSAWAPLPHDMLGAVLDQAVLIDQVANLLGMLGTLDVPVPGRVAPAIGIEPASRVTEGKVSDMPRTQAGGFKMVPHLRVEPDDAIAYDHVIRHPRDVAEEIVARLLAALRNH